MNGRRSITLAILVVLLLTFTVSGTLAYLIDVTEPVTNVFTPAKADVDVTDEVEDNTKKDVIITNNSDFKAYIRVAVVANWYKDGEIVAPWRDYDRLEISESNWVRGSDGYYYYKTPVEPNTAVTLFNEYEATNDSAGAHLEMDIIAQCIQAEPTAAVKAAWGVTVDANGNISGTTADKP